MNKKKILLGDLFVCKKPVCLFEMFTVQAQMSAVSTDGRSEKDFKNYTWQVAAPSHRHPADSKYCGVFF